MVREGGYSRREGGPPRPGRKEDAPTIGATPALEAFRAAALGPAAVGPFSSEDSRLTSLETYTQNQVSELIYQQLLAKKEQSGIDAWYQEYVSEAWQKRNLLQKTEIDRRAKECGENTPMWIEALTLGMELSGEVLESTAGSERLCTQASRDAVLELLDSLSVKVSISHYARCGFGQSGLRPLVAALCHFAADAEVLGKCADSLRWSVKANAPNRDALLDVHVPLPPEHGTGEGWSFLLFALDAFVFQAGGKLRPLEGIQRVETARDEQVAVKLGECLLTGEGWLKKLATAEPCKEQQEIKKLIPEALRLVSELSVKVKGNKVLKDLEALLKAC